MNDSDQSGDETRVAVVTGGSKGLGRALAEQLAVEGWSVVIDGRDAVALATAAERIRAQARGAVIAIPGDVTDATHRQALVDAAESVGGLHLLVNNASVLGPSPLPPLGTYPLQDLRSVLEVNVIAPLALIQAALPALRRCAGAIIDVTSDAAVEGYEGWGGYGASKAALDQLSNVLRAEEPSVRVYAFDPGDMRTAMHQEACPGEDISDRPEPESVVPAVMRLLGESAPSGRYRAADLAGEQHAEAVAR